MKQVVVGIVLFFLAYIAVAMNDQYAEEADRLERITINKVGR